MQFKDKEMKCLCGKKFYWTAKDQEYYKDMGFSAPKRCMSCRKNKKNYVQKNRE